MVLDYKITVAILNWNGLGHLREFLPSVVAHSEEAQILMIDNASTDDSVSWVRQAFPHIQVEVLPENLGFTGGYNAGLGAVKTEFCVLLNSDVEVTAGWLPPLISLMETRKDVAACQPKILSYRQRDTFEYAGASGGFIDILGYPFCRGRLFDHCEKDLGQYDTAQPVFWASGACMVVRMETYRQFGGLEPQFFAHMEEIDLCWRFQQAGWAVWVVPASQVYHLGAGTLARSNPRKTFLNFRNGLAVFYCNTPDSSIYWKFSLRLIMDGLAGIQFLLKGQAVDCWAIVRAHFHFYGQWKYWKKRRDFQKKLIVKGSEIKGLYPSSIVWTYFVKGCRRFSDLRF